MDQFTRRIIGFGIHQGNVNGPALCRMFNVTISKQNLPSYLSSDNDPLFLYHRWQANLRILEIDEVKSVPYTPISHPFVERLIGSIRREFLDQTFFWTATDLERKLLGYQQCFNHHRTHSGFDGAFQCALRRWPSIWLIFVGSAIVTVCLNCLWQLELAIRHGQADQ